MRLSSLRLWKYAVVLGAALVTLSAASFASDYEAKKLASEAGQEPSPNATRQQTKEEVLAKLIGDGIADARAGRYTKAIAEYKQALVVDPTCTPASINLGLAYFKLGNFRDATGPLETALHEGADTDQVHTLLAMSFYSLHQYREAGLEYEVLFKREPSITTLQYFLAESYMRSHQADELPGLVERLHAISPDSPVVHMLAGEQYDRQDRTDDAILEFEQAAAAAPDMPLVHFSLGYLYWERHRWDEAAKEFRLEAGMKDGEVAQALGFLGDIAVQNGDQANAEHLFNESLKIDSDVRIAQYGLGVICSDENQSSEAKRHLEAAIKLDPQNADAYYRLARVYRQLGRPDRQRELLAKVAELHAAERRSVGETISPKP
jgi:tetratricopeptide (TPR) repeat protein